MRYLTDQPVEACPPSAWYRFSKFARRNRAALTTAALVAVALLAGTGVSTWQAIRAVRAERGTAAALAQAVQAERSTAAALDQASSSASGPPGRRRDVHPGGREVAGGSRAH